MIAKKFTKRLFIVILILIGIVVSRDVLQAFVKLVFDSGI